MSVIVLSSSSDVIQFINVKATSRIISSTEENNLAWYAKNANERLMAGLTKQNKYLKQ